MSLFRDAIGRKNGETKRSRFGPRNRSSADSANVVFQHYGEESTKKKKKEERHKYRKNIIISEWYRIAGELKQWPGIIHTGTGTGALRLKHLNLNYQLDDTKCHNVNIY